MNKIVYVVTIEEISDLEDYPHKPRVFSKEEDAIKHIKEVYEIVESEFDDSYTKEYEEGDKSAWIYKEGYWSSDRWVITMNECVVDAEI